MPNLLLPPVLRAAVSVGLLGCTPESDENPLETDAATETDPDIGTETGEPDHTGYVMVPFTEAEFFPASPDVPEGAAVAFLWGDPATGPVAYLLRIPPNPALNLGPHTHSSRYDAISLNDGWKHWLAGEDEASVPTHAPGTYISQPAGQAHVDTCAGPDDCLFFLYMPDVFDFIPMPDAEPVEDPGGYAVVTPDDRQFAPILPDFPEGPATAIAFGDPVAGPVAYFLDLPPGWDSGLHNHTSDYHAVTLTGTPRHWLVGEDSAAAEVLAAWTYWFQPSSVSHGDACDGSESCLSFLVMPGGIDFIPAP